jgi:hypothetical protein
MSKENLVNLISLKTVNYPGLKAGAWKSSKKLG